MGIGPSGKRHSTGGVRMDARFQYDGDDATMAQIAADVDSDLARRAAEAGTDADETVETSAPQTSGITADDTLWPAPQPVDPLGQVWDLASHQAVTADAQILDAQLGAYEAFTGNPRLASRQGVVTQLMISGAHVPAGDTLKPLPSVFDVSEIRGEKRALYGSRGEPVILQHGPEFGKSRKTDAERRDIVRLAALRAASADLGGNFSDVANDTDADPVAVSILSRDIVWQYLPDNCLVHLPEDVEAAVAKAELSIADNERLASRQGADRVLIAAGLHQPTGDTTKSGILYTPGLKADWYGTRGKRRGLQGITIDLSISPVPALEA